MDISKEDNSFRNLIKGTSIFGGVQVVQILINLIRAKFVAIFLGPEGMGINSLYNSSTAFIQQLSSLGINLSIVKEISSARNNGDYLNSVIHVSLKLIILTALLGVIIIIICSPILSNFTFGNYSHTIEFVLLSIMIFFSITSAGLLSILQGLHVIRLLSKATLIGSITGLTIGVPLYYFFGNNGIVPSMIIIALTTVIFYWIGLKNVICIKWEKIELNKHRLLIKRIFKLGFALVSSTLIGTALLYLLNIIIREYGSYNMVGLFQSANSITNQYVGMIFTAMSLDYFPRLSAISKDTLKMNELVNKQLIITCSIITPLTCLLIITAPFVIRILLTDSFLSIIPLVRWMASGLIFRAVCYPISYITFAVGNEKRFFIIEGILGNIIYYGISIILFINIGLIGLGISLIIVYLLLFIIITIINHKWYGFSLEKSSLRVVLTGITIVGTCLCCSFFENFIIMYIMMVLLSIVAITYSYITLRNRINQ